MAKYKRRATREEAIKFIEGMMADKGLRFTEHIRLILEEIFPFSWLRYCEGRNLSTEILMDEYERNSKRRKKKLEAKR